MPDTIDGAIYLGTILLEPNRWAKGKQPTYLVSDWVERAKADGFDGLELWENHAALASPEELERLAQALPPLAIYNTYCGFATDDAPQRDQALALATKLGAQGLKFNVGGDPNERVTYLRELDTFAQRCPCDWRLLCECHPGTVVEDPKAAAAFFDELGRERFEMMVHAFSWGTGPLQAWFDQLGDRITHVHVQMRDPDGTMIGLADAPDRVTETLGVLRDRGFHGSYTLEFTRGTRAAEECVDGLYRAALSDLQVLREALT